MPNGLPKVLWCPKRFGLCKYCVRGPKIILLQLQRLQVIQGFLTTAVVCQFYSYMFNSVFIPLLHFCNLYGFIQFP